MANTYEVHSGRMYLPPEDLAKPTERKVFFPETLSENVLVPKSDGTTLPLDDFLGENVRVATSSNFSNYDKKEDAVVVCVTGTL